MPSNEEIKEEDTIPIIEIDGSPLDAFRDGIVLRTQPSAKKKKKKQKKEKFEELRALQQHAVYLSYQPNSEKAYFYKPETPAADIN